MKTLIKKILEIIPAYVIFPLITIFSMQSLVYFGTKLLNGNMQPHVLTTVIDEKTPIIPLFAVIYLACYVFWVLNYALAGRPGKEYFYNFIMNVFIGYLISGFIFCIFPSYIERPDLQEIPDGLGKFLMNYVYTTDTPVNVFPSMHCQISWYCYLAVRKQPTIPKWYQFVSLVIAVLVCISTVVIKQHYFVDIIGGVLIAELTYRLCMTYSLGKHLSFLFEKVNKKLNLA